MLKLVFEILETLFNISVRMNEITLDLIELYFYASLLFLNREIYLTLYPQDNLAHQKTGRGSSFASDKILIF